MTKTLKDVVNEYCGEASELDVLKKALSDALIEVTSGDHVSRAYRAQMVIEAALSELACEQDG